MKKRFAMLAVFVVFFLAFAVMASASTYGYVVLKGKNEAQLDREAVTIERLVSEWKNGEVLFKLKESSGLLFFKKHTISLVFAGYEKDVSAFLTSGPYDGDIVKDVVVRLTYSSYISSREAIPGNVTIIDKSFPNVRKAIELIKGKTENNMWEYLKTSKPKDYKKHLVDGKLVDPKLDVIFYSLRPVEGNRMFSFTLGEGFTREIK
ncbi:MAG: hypothetical protein EOM80_18280 [Erysipelotrichia bacterium]|nr:hypothetical protein [Erysipelotrichia bacterium]